MPHNTTRNGEIFDDSLVSYEGIEWRVVSIDEDGVTMISTERTPHRLTVSPECEKLMHRVTECGYPFGNGIVNGHPHYRNGSCDDEPCNEYGWCRAHDDVHYRSVTCDTFESDAAFIARLIAEERAGRAAAGLSRHDDGGVSARYVAEHRPY